MIARFIRRTAQGAALLVVTSAGLNAWAREKQRKALELPNAFVLEIDLENNQVGMPLGAGVRGGQQCPQSEAKRRWSCRGLNQSWMIRGHSGQTGVMQLRESERRGG